MVKAVLVDDEILAQELLEAMLLEMGNVEVVGKYLNPEEGLKQMIGLQPDVVFLDIDMPGMSGMDVAKKLDGLETEIIFVTAYDQYALEAFHVQAAGYILKPIDNSQLQKAVDRIARRQQPDIAKKIEGKAALQTQLFGPFQITGPDNHPIRWRTRKVKELCAFLIDRKQSVHRDLIIEELWPETSYDKAAGLLHTTVYQLRKTFKEIAIDAPIQFTNERYTLTVPISTDLEKLQLLLKEGNISELISYYHEDYLSGEDFPWALARKERIHKELIQALNHFQQSADAETMKGDLYRKVAEKLIELEPSEEQFHMQLVQHFIANHHYSDAREAYQDYKNYLSAELGEKPGTTFTDIVRKIQ